MNLEGPALGVLCGMSASLAWAVANIAIVRATRAAGDLVSVLWGQLFGALMLACALPFWPVHSVPQQPLWLVVGGLASAVGYVGMFRAFGRGPLSVLSPIIAGWAVISAGIGVLVFDEAMPPLRLLGAVLVVGGVMGVASRSAPGTAAVSPADAWTGPRWRVIGLAMFSATGFGLMVAALGPIGQDLGPVAGILAVWGVQWLVVLPLAWRTTRGRLLPPPGLLPTLALLGVAEATGFLMVEVGALSAPLTVVAPTASTAALVTVGLARVWLGEAVGWDRALLALVVVGGIGLLAVG